MPGSKRTFVVDTVTTASKHQQASRHNAATAAAVRDSAHAALGCMKSTLARDLLNINHAKIMQAQVKLKGAAKNLRESRKDQLLTEDQLNMIFSFLDCDADGRISAAEMRHAM
jgi:hypothetical protein